MAIIATVNLINNYFTKVYATHLESGSGVNDFLYSMLIREEQMHNIVKNFRDAEKHENFESVIIGGDFNAPFIDGLT